MTEDAYALGEGPGLSVWCCDQAGPFQTVPQPGQSWQPEGKPARQPHEYVRDGTAKPLTLLRPAPGQVRVEGATACPDEVLHGWLKRQLSEVLAGLPDPPPTAEASRAAWPRWRHGPSVRVTPPEQLPPSRVLLVLDDLAGHKTPGLVPWLLAHGVMPLYAPVGGSWLDVAGSIQRTLKRRAPDGQHPTSTGEIIGRLEAAAGRRNEDPTPFGWGGKRERRRERQRERRHRLGGSGAFTREPVRQQPGRSYGHTQRK